MEKQQKPVPNDDKLVYKGTPDSPDIKIFVSHRIDVDSEQIDNLLYVPVRCGAVYDRSERSDMLGDDTGDNISEKRMSYCELTVQYWAWKNVEADYYGLCHYRRYIGFSNEHFPVGTSERNNGCVCEPEINEEIIKKHCLDEAAMTEEIKNYDVIAIEPIKLRSNPRSNYEAMKQSSDYHNMADLDVCIEIIKSKYPEMSDAVDSYMHKTKECWLYNCWIMKKTLFFEYSAWLFDILKETEDRIDTRYYSQQMLRTPGTLGERLFGIYLTYLGMQGSYKIKKHQLVFFERVEKIAPITPAFSDNNIAIASNFNNNYVPVFSVLLKSIINNSSRENNYDVILLSQDISDENKKKLLTMTANKPNFSLRFVNPDRYTCGLNMYVAFKEYTSDMYVRVLIPHVLEKYDKVLVLDADMISKTDVSLLYNTELGGHCAAAVKDVVYGGYLNGVVEGTLEYSKNTLRLSEPYNYCNTGVILLDCKKIRELYTLEYLQNYIDTHNFRIYEQDTLNVLLDGKILFLDRRWNMYTYTSDAIVKCVNYAPFKDKQEYLEARKDPWILHYAAHPKPWWTGVGDFAYDFWEVARTSPYYEELISEMYARRQSTVNPSSKESLVKFFKKILPGWMHPLGKKIKRMLKW